MTRTKDLTPTEQYRLVSCLEDIFATAEPVSGADLVEAIGLIFDETYTSLGLHMLDQMRNERDRS